MKIIDLKCPRCGGNLSWEEGAESAHCPYCNANFAVEPERAKVFIQETVNNFGGPARPEQGQEQSPILRGFLLALGLLTAVPLAGFLLAGLILFREPSSSPAERTTEAALLSSMTIENQTDLSALLGQTGLSELVIRDSPEISDYSALSALPHLRSLSISDAPKLEDASFLRSLSGLEELSLINTGISDLSPLSGRLSLISLSLEGNPISDYSFLPSLRSLQTLKLRDVPKEKLPDLSSLSGLSELETAASKEGE